MAKMNFPKPEEIEALPFANGFDEAHEAKDYPYGRLRTSMFYYTESRGGFGTRPVTRSINPKTGKLNAPHAGNYVPVLVIYRDLKNGHLEFASIDPMYYYESAGDFFKTFEKGMTTAQKFMVKTAEFYAEIVKDLPDAERWNRENIRKNTEQAKTLAQNWIKDNPKTF